ncbi:hypothetical protein P170DRAFT_77402 [Aspergillus steynii IBT 23096]|uniref:Uncharacterized protein n=1 Tax=Aspergillus steynii IBT 23096 TaxID=1392250 RepID=A0A2I2FS45_9EURO|nr:uncharacterized protein P170DRAFT_77402 [Aspergillus steynii IBT 23096]PLB43437.1 hypothetical protein P170DRAFT_77402 [Aspergillus steynii IBT 23096]
MSPSAMHSIPPSLNTGPLPSRPRLHTVRGCSNVYIKKGTDQTILDFFDQIFGAKFIIVDHTANENIFRVRYLVVESQEYPEQYHFLNGRDLGWAVQYQHDSKAIRGRLDALFKHVCTRDSTAHDLECRVSVFLIKYFARMLKGLVESGNQRDSATVTNLYRWVHSLNRVAREVFPRHQRCGFRDHRDLVCKAHDRLMAVILGCRITHNQAPNRLPALCVYEDSDYFHKQGGLLH